MINRQTEEAASLYVLDLLGKDERAQFESAMRESSELQRLVQELADGIYAPFRGVDEPARPDLLDGILKEVSGNSNVGNPGTESRQASVSWAYIWAAAAVILLGLNLILLFLVRDQASIRTNELLAATEDMSTSLVDGVSDPLDLAPEDREILEARIARLQEELATKQDQVEKYRSDLDRVEGEAAEVRNYNTEWQQEYARLAARILPFFEQNDGLGRFTVIEMVDNEVFSNDLPRRGFADLAGRFLSGEGNIAGVGTDEFIGPVVEGAGVLSATLDSSQGGLAPIARGAGTPLADNLPPATEVAGPHSDEPADQEGRPTGFTVWRDDEQKGFLDLYNLPQVTEGQEAYLWVRASELDPYIPVGVVPTLENGTGSIFYSIDEPNFTPSEILITAEREGAAGVVPGETVILRGP